MNSIAERRALVKQFVIYDDQKTSMKKQLDDPNTNTSNSTKIHLNEEMEKKELRMRDIQKEIALKYNLNIKNDIKKIEIEQE